MINAINSSQNFGAMQITAFRKTTDLAGQSITKQISKIDNEKKESIIKTILNAYLPYNGKDNSSITDVTAKKISEAIKMLTNVDLDPKNYDKKILKKINENRFVFGNEKVMENGAKSIIDFNI